MSFQMLIDPIEPPFYNVNYPHTICITEIVRAVRRS